MNYRNYNMLRHFKKTSDSSEIMIMYLAKLKMKLLLIGFCLLNISSSFKCIQGKDGTKIAEECAETSVDKCSQPKFVEYTGINDGKYNCGGCDLESAEICSECSTDGCNTPYELGESFECLDYVWDPTKEVWYNQTDTTTCHRLKDTDIRCNMPGTAADADYSFPNNGCGPCATDAANNTCVECDTDKCNIEEEDSSATTITAVLLPLVAAIYSIVM